MSSTNIDKLKLEYQELPDEGKFLRYAREYGGQRKINLFKAKDSYWSAPSESDNICPNIFEYNFPAFYEYREELLKVFELYGFPEAGLYSYICAVAAFKRQPHVMLLWERRKAHGLKDYTLNTHELFYGTGPRPSAIEQLLGQVDGQADGQADGQETNQNQAAESEAEPPSLRYTIY